MRAEPPPRRAATAARWAPEAAALALILAAYAVCANAVPFGQYADDVLWVLLSKNMLRGSVESAWSYFPRFEVNRNWGLSILLMPAVAAAGRHIGALKIYSACLFCAGLFLFYWTVRKPLDIVGKCVFLSLLFLNGYALSYSGAILSEIGYMFLFGLIVFLLFEKGWLADDSWRKWTLLGGLSSLLLLTRTPGALVAMTVGLDLLRRRRWRTAAGYGAIVVAGWLPFGWVSRIASGSVTYYGSYWSLRWTGGISEILSGCAANLFYYAKGLACLTCLNGPGLPVPSALAKPVLMILAAGLCGAGLWAERKSDLGRFLAIYGGGYILLFGAWSYRDPRYMLPFYPLFIFWLSRGLFVLGRRWGGWRVSLLVAALSLASNAADIVRLARKSLTASVQISTSSYEWFAAHSNADDLTVSMDFGPLFYFSGRKSIPFVPSDSLANFVEESHRLGVRYYFMREAGYVQGAGGVADPIIKQAALFNGYMSHAEYFERIYVNEQEHVKIFIPKWAPSPVTGNQ